MTNRIPALALLLILPALSAQADRRHDQADDEEDDHHTEGSCHARDRRQVRPAPRDTSWVCKDSSADPGTFADRKWP